MITEERKQKIISEAFATFGVSAWGVLYNVGLEIADNIILESQQSSITAVVQAKLENCDHEWRVDSFDHFGFPLERYCEKCDEREAI